MFISCVYWLFRHLLGLAVLRCRSKAATEVEIPGLASRDRGAPSAGGPSELPDRYRRLVRRRGKLKALVAVARSILVVVWHLLADPSSRYRDLGADFCTNHIDQQRKARQLIRQLEALGHTVILDTAPAA